MSHEVCDRHTDNIVAALIKNRKRIFEKSQPTLLQRERERE